MVKFVSLPLDDHIHSDFCYERGLLNQASVKLNCGDVRYTVDKCSTIVLKQLDDVDNFDDNSDKYVEITANWDLSELPENDFLARD